MTCIYLSFQQAIFPEALKTARVILYLKEEIFNFLLIIVTSMFCRFLANCMKNVCIHGFTRFWQNINCFNNHSTSHALISLIDLIKKYLDNDYFVCGVCIDLQKLFDTVKHEILLVKLDFYGIRGLANNWLKSFLENGKQYVNLPGYSSSVKTVMVFHKVQH